MSAPEALPFVALADVDLKHCCEFEVPASKIGIRVLVRCDVVRAKHDLTGELLGLGISL